MKTSKQQLAEEYHNLKFSTSKIEAALRHLNPRKAPGEDGIHYKFLKNLGSKLIAWLTLFFNTCFKGGNIPNMWRRAHLCSFNKLLSHSSSHQSKRSGTPARTSCFRQGRSILDQNPQQTRPAEKSCRRFDGIMSAEWRSVGRLTAALTDGVPWKCRHLD